MSPPIARFEIAVADARRRDAGDPLAPLREHFSLPPDVVYLDGNSLGPLPHDTAYRLQHAVQADWGKGLIRSWNEAGWIDLPTRVGDKIGRLVGAAPGQVVVADSTSVNLFKVLDAALAARPDRSVIVSQAGNFPTDLYVAQGIRTRRNEGIVLKTVDGAGELPAAIDARTAVVMLTQVDYRTGERLDMARLTGIAHRAGALVIWDLAHSAGAFPVELDTCGADFAVGCGYKYLNGGPGAPAFVYVADRHQASFAPALAGWMGHASPFEFAPVFRPADGIRRALVGTPPVLGTIALEAGVDTMLAAEPLGGLVALREKSLALTDLFIELALAGGADHGLVVITPREHHRRGSQASFTLPDPRQAYAVVQALIADGVIGDFRAPDVLRFGFAPAYLRFTDVVSAASRLAEVLETRRWNQPRFLARQEVT